MDMPIDNAPVCSPAESDPEDSQASRVSRKRARDSAKEQHFEEQFDINDDGRPKTRRVNPARLALRLGPELVAEMEALIVPGAKMPTFAVRKDFQERVATAKDDDLDYLPFPSSAESYLSPLLVGGHNGMLDSEYLSFCVDAETPSVDNSLGQGERTALYNLVQNSLHSGTMNGNPTSSYGPYIKDWTLFSNRMAAFNATGKDMVANPYGLEYSPALSYGYSGESSPELFDLRSWLSEDLAREDAQGLHSTSDTYHTVIHPMYIVLFKPVALFKLKL
ncbi:hypothetical protein EST38_g6522 [Candolleomyces aberdarensis]|uniref:Uncharacterized protein n=1 Tax=Candolleomyces aberdarensis TaxID=2316362 RepID=A0A4Q2DHF6_9AGAR|nr:hypothetical protein EST38_g6522 [Candolleomyces aberdarensis]